MPNKRRREVPSIRATAIVQIPSGTRIRNLDDIVIVAHDPDTLHAHDHVLQDVAVDHPDLGVYVSLKD